MGHTVDCTRHRKIASGNSSQVARLVATAIILSTSVSMVKATTGHVAIVNSFPSRTQFTCNSNKISRQTFTAITNEIYYFAFNTADHQFWNCKVFNRIWGAIGYFQFWGDERHGGPDLWNCVNCNWIVESAGIYFYVDGAWRYKYSWDYGT
uniref:S-protein homolog n=1 Tax=Physcomitrium patens TaxID=3218 RepID=A0A2K1IW23_PHYPA|nr:hypothetical protein PHYPA_025421 [Physcomitrium patens]